MNVLTNYQLKRQDFDDLMVPNYVPDSFIPVKGEGVYIWDQKERKYLDFTSGIAVCALGHCHPVLLDELNEQAHKLWHISNIYTNEPALKLANQLINATCAERVFFANSGGEANEVAFKLARRYAIMKYGEQKHQIISMQNSFHGRSLFTVSVGGQAHYSENFGPKIAGIAHIPFNDIKALEQTISDNTCAVVLELIQGESGVLPASAQYVQQVRKLCDKHQALLIIDEVQTGMGRTGKLFAYEHYDIKPDIFTSAKGLGGGFPIGAMLTSQEIAQYLPVGTHGSTFGGNPLACSVACKVLEYINQPQILSSVIINGNFLVEQLEKLNAKTNFFNQIRGKGLLVGAVLANKFSGKVAKIREFAANEGLMVLQAGNNVIRFAPSLLINQDEITQGLDLLNKAVHNFMLDEQ